LLRQNENSWSFTKSHETKFFNKLDCKVSAVVAGVKASVQNTTEWTTTDKTLEETKKHNVDITEVSLITDITIKPRTRAFYTINWREVDASIPFTATVKVKGLADRLKKDGSVKSMAVVDSEGVLALLKHSGYEGEIIGTDGESTLARISGTLKVTGAISGKMDFDTKPL
jgi:hypothetical protein